MIIISNVSLLKFILIINLLSNIRGSVYDQWAKHSYCNFASDIQKTSSIRPLRSEQIEKYEPELMQVQVVARHGARVPYYRVFCWDVDPNPVRSSWDCGPSDIFSEDITIHKGKTKSRSQRYFKKQYSAKYNVLNGTCSVGSILPNGISQHHENGRILRNAYIGEGKLKLFRTSKLNDISLEEIYLRCDDEQRTLSSGQAIINGMFPIPEEGQEEETDLLTWVTADYATDIINANDKICPMMGVASESFIQNSKNLQSIVNSAEFAQLEKELNKTLGSFQWDTVLECLVISRCNELPLPDGVDESLYNRTIESITLREFYHLTFNNSRYAKLSTMPLMNKILTHQQDAILSDLNEEIYKKFLLFVGHDTTLMPLLASIFGENWDKEWAPYASMIIFELYKINSNVNKSEYMIRILYQGKPLIVPGCSDDLCDFDQFNELMEFGRTPRHCEIDNNNSVGKNTLGDNGKNKNNYLAIIIAISIVILTLSVLGFLIIKKKRGSKVGKSGELAGLLDP